MLQIKVTEDDTKKNIETTKSSRNKSVWSSTPMVKKEVLDFDTNRNTPVTRERRIKKIPIEDSVITVRREGVSTKKENKKLNMELRRIEMFWNEK